MARGVFGTGSGFRVEWRAVGKVGLISVFQGSSAGIGEAFILVGGLGAGLVL